MQPETPQKPVMDVSVPPRPAAAPPVSSPRPSPPTSLAVHEAPAGVSGTSQPLPQPQESAPPAKKQERPVSRIQAKPASTAPVGTIVATLFVMIALAAAAVVVYLKS